MLLRISVLYCFKDHFPFGLGAPGYSLCRVSPKSHCVVREIKLGRLRCVPSLIGRKSLEYRSPEAVPNLWRADICAPLLLVERLR